uniref:Uncharacterized protein n=1 Tax=Ascaris lumbricoides TaxID=6252 RepID=A0A0M3IMH7_ASCLU
MLILILARQVFRWEVYQLFALLNLSPYPSYRYWQYSNL